MKKCSKCGNEYPVTSEFFYKDKSRNNGYSHYCKKCDAKKRQNNRIKNNYETKTVCVCKECNKSFFKRSTGSKTKGLFCSRECAFKYRYDKNSIIKKCKYCNNTFKGVTRDVFCSNDCKLKHFEDKKKRKLNKSLISLLKKRITKLKSEEKERQRIQIKTKVCKYCGSNFISVKGRLFCSETCSKKFGNKQKEIRRYKRLHENGCVDNSITLIKLYYKFDGVCQLCGEIVDYNDYLIDEKGSFIAGENYPSVDHIYPVSCGGTHTWDNVQLAHRRCNTLKSNKFKED